MNSIFLSKLPIVYLLRLRRSINNDFVGSVREECQRIYTTKGKEAFMPGTHFYTSTFERNYDIPPIEVGGEITAIGQLDVNVPVQLGITPPVTTITTNVGEAGAVGTGPHGLATYDGSLYISCFNSNDVYVFDGTSWALSGAVGTGPVGLAEYDGKLYVACRTTNNIYVFDGTSWALSGAVGTGPLYLAEYDGKLYVSCRTSDDVYVYDGVSWTLSGGVGTGPHGLAVYDSKLYVACYDSNNVYVYDGVSWTLSGGVGSSPADLEVYSGKLYASCLNSDDVYVFDGTSWTLSGSVGTSPYGLSEYAGKLYVACRYSYNVYVFDGISWALSGTVGTGPVQLAEYANKLYVVCFTSSDIYIFDGATWAEAGGVGGVTGGYYYKATYRNSQGFESNANNASGLISLSSEGCALTDIPRSSDPQVVERRIYRTKGGGTTYHFLTTIEDNATTTYLDNSTDLALGGTIETNHDVPEIFSEIHSHKSLLRGVEAAEKNVVWWCNSFDGWEYFDIFNYDTFGSTSDESQTIETLSDSMVVVQKHKVWNLNTMEEPEELAQSLAARGVPNPKACWNAGEVLIMVDNSGIFLYDKLTDVCISGPIDPLFDAEGAHVRRINEDHANNLCVCTLNDKVVISYTSIHLQATTNDTTLIFDKRNGIFQGMVPVGFSDFTVNKTDKIIYGAGTDGIIYKLETNSDDEGTDIDWHFQTKDFTTETGGVGVLKKGNIAKIDCNPNGGTITIDVFLDGVSSQTLTITGDNRKVKRWRLPVDVDFYRISFKVSGSGQQYIYGIMFTFKELGF